MYYIYHVMGKKIGVTQNINNRVIIEQGYSPSEFEILELSDDINYISKKERQLQKEYGYKIDKDSYKQVINQKKQQKMKLNVTEQTVTFPCPVGKLKGRLMDAIGLNFETPEGKYILDIDLADWIVKNAFVSMFNSDRSFVYNKALAKYVNLRDSLRFSNINNIDVNGHVEVKRSINEQLEEALSNFQKAQELSKSHKTESNHNDNVYGLIREWALDKGIYKSGDSKTQYVKLMEEAGELAQAILKQNKAEIKDAIGDMIVVLTNLAYLEGMPVEDCIISAYDEIKNRKGSMRNGSFVKESDTKAKLNRDTTITLN